jgi:hypothetical protein
MVAFVDCFQGRKREATGGDTAAVTLGCRSLMSICCEIGGTNGFSGRARARKEEGEQREGKASRSSPKLAMHAASTCGLRREISMAWRRNLRRKRERGVAERVGFYGGLFLQ